MALLGAGCFDEGGGDAAQAKTIETLVQGLIAFGDIHSNIETDPGAAGIALLEFIKWPVAADALLSPPFGGETEVMDTSMRLAPTLPVPDCLLQSGEPACDTYTTTDTCEAGGFTFRGNMTRRCWDCDNPRDVCSYAWTLPELKFTSSKFELSLSTAGTWTGVASEITPNLSARYDLNVFNGTDSIRYGNVSACACTPFTIVDSPTTSGKPRKLVNTQFIVRLIAFDYVTASDRCALVTFDGNGNPSVEDSCKCSTGDTCVAPTAENQWPTTCGNGTCGPNENYENCPVDCQFEQQCGNSKCEIGEDRLSCPADCGALIP